MQSVKILYILSAQASLLWFIASALWGSLLTIGNRPCGNTYTLALIATHITTALSILLLILLAWAQVVPHIALSLVYYFVALFIVPCIVVYVPKDKTRYQTLAIALSCLFASGMVLRSLQTLRGSY
jgi:hypothetical protein